MLLEVSTYVISMHSVSRLSCLLLLLVEDIFLVLPGFFQLPWLPEWFMTNRR
jgi:hypothetical protein